MVQDSSKVGAGLRTISLRLTGTESAKKELEELGEDVSDFTVTTISKLDQKIKDLTKTQDKAGVSLLDLQGNYRSTKDILLDIGKVWDTIAEEDKLTGENRQNALLEMMAGKNRSNILASVLESPEILESAYESALNADGSAQEELDKYLDSITGHMAQFKNQWQKLWADTADRDIVNFFIDLGTALLKFVDNIGIVNAGIGALAIGLTAGKTLTSGGRVKMFTLTGICLRGI